MILHRFRLSLLALAAPLFLAPSIAMAAPDAWFSSQPASTGSVTCHPQSGTSSTYVCSTQATSTPVTAPGPVSSSSSSPTASPMPSCGWWAPCTSTAPSSSGGSTSSSGTGSSQGGSSAGTSGLSGQAAQFLALVNAYRSQMGVAPLRANATLDALALIKAEDMVQNGYVGHVSPDLGSPFQQEIQAGYRAQMMGAENIAEAGSIERALINLENDPGHQANLLNPGFTQTGIAVVPIPYGVLVEELFSGPAIP